MNKKASYKRKSALPNRQSKKTDQGYTLVGKLDKRR